MPNSQIADARRPMVEILINIDVENAHAAERFYCAAFELKPGRRFGDVGVELIGGTSKIYLLAKDTGTPGYAGAKATRSYQRHWTPVHLDFIVTDLEQAIARSIAAGATAEQPIRDNPWGRIAVMADPFGHGYCLIQFSDAGYDAIASE